MNKFLKILFLTVLPVLVSFVICATARVAAFYLGFNEESVLRGLGFAFPILIVMGYSAYLFLGIEKGERIGSFLSR